MPLILQTQPPPVSGTDIEEWCSLRLAAVLRTMREPCLSTTGVAKASIDPGRFALHLEQIGSPIISWYPTQVLIVPIVSLQSKPTTEIRVWMADSGKRTTQINVKMSTEDFALLRRAAEKLWPGAIISNSGILLGLAKMGASDVLRRKNPKKA